MSDQGQRLPGRARLGTGWLWGDLPLLLAAGWALVAPLSGASEVWEGDLFLHLRLGEWIVGGGSPSGDPAWTYGPHEPWTNTMAVAEVVFAWLQHAVGWGGLAAYAVAAQVAALLCGWWAFALVAPHPAVRRSPGPARVGLFALVIAAVVIQAGGMTMRPQSLSLAVAPLLGVAVLRTALTGRFPRLVVLLPLTWLWVCWHGYGLLVGPLLLAGAGVHVVATFLGTPRARRRDATRRALTRVLRGLGAPLGALAVTLATPAGWGVWVSAVKIRTAASTIISEWQATELTSQNGLFVLGLVAGWVVVALMTALRATPSGGVVNAGTRRALVAEGLLMVVLTIGLASNLRTALLLLPLLGVVLAHRWMRLPGVRGARVRRWEHGAPPGMAPVLRWVGIVALVLAVGYAGSQARVDRGRVPTALYRQMAQVMAADPAAHRILVDYNTSSIAQYYLPAGVRVSLDGRTDRYGPTVLMDYLHLMQGGPRWRLTMLSDYPGTTDALFTDDESIVRVLRQADWRVAGTQPGLTAGGRATHWIWLTAPAR